MKKLYPIILIVVLAALAVIASLFREQRLCCVDQPMVTEQQNQPQQTPPVSDTAPVSTADWKTYRNNEVGIEFQYPKSIGEPNIYTRNSSEDNSGVFSGKSLNVFFDSGSIGFRAFTPDFQGFVYEPFLGKDEAISHCSQPNIYSSSGDVCKVIDLAGQKAVFENNFYEVECSPSLETRIYLNNKSESDYKGLEFTLGLRDANREIMKVYSCMDEKESEIFYKEANRQSHNTVEQKNLSSADKIKLDLFNQIVSTFKFTD